MEDIEGKTREILEKKYRLLLSDLFLEIAEQASLHKLSPSADHLNNNIRAVLTGPVEDLPKYAIGGSHFFRPVAAWRLENPSATLPEVLEAAFSYCEENQGALLDALFMAMSCEHRLKALALSIGEAGTLIDLFELYGMEEEKRVAQIIRVDLAEQMDGWAAE